MCYVLENIALVKYQKRTITATLIVEDALIFLTTALRKL